MKHQRISRLLLLIVFLSSCVMLLQYCHRHEDKQDILRYALLHPLQHFDPYYTFDPDVLMVYQHVVESLYKMDSSGKIYPLLAVDLPYMSDDRRSYTITLRDDIFFHNGQEISSEDVAYVFTRMFYADYPSVHKDLYKMIVGASQMLSGNTNELVGIEIHNDKRFTIHLEEPYEHFLANLTLPYAGIYAKRAYLESSYQWGTQVLVGSGSYRWHRLYEQDRLELVRFMSYHGLQPTVDRLVFSFYANATEAIKAYENDQVQMMTISLQNVLHDCPPWLLADLVEVDRIGTLSLLLNDTVGPLQNLLVRQAIALAIDRELLVDIATQNRGIAMYNYLPSIILGSTEESLSPQRNVEKAQALLVEAGYPNGLSITVSYPASSSMERTIWKALAAQLQEIGMKLVLLEVSPQYWQEQKAHGEHLMTLIRLNAYSKDADLLLYPLLHSTMSPVYYRDTIIDQWLETARRSDDGEYRARIYQDIETKIIQEDVILLPLLTLPYYYLIKPYVYYRPLRFSSENLSWAVIGRERERERAYVFTEEGKA
ncbi:ABC transporter substrate-binding protein (plasmid) [Entomospira nematocerorum]|uniref:ABC transporter substrate-binding protein n=1 Tax=Entomospira nematocerorum TaxID=2719987 RepID=A0A968KTN9_9SPIO|nr:ABC transporter substrate-binding protein [Entomospira nematocera]NIZ47581.1 ABC transporter substrate-binding protein [Entomospira nematocera]WDI34585.1 ABC transporter substrate-binding protein [Entomospira nematocera]